MLTTTGTLPVPPTRTDISLLLDRATNLADLARADVSKLLPELPADTSLWVHVDLVQAIRHLLRASILIDRAADALEADAAALQNTVTIAVEERNCVMPSHSSAGAR
jgi:hypothetical protein